MIDMKIRTLVRTALLVALVCVATIVIRIPSPTGGYKNLGDCFVLLSGWILGPWYGCAAAGIGSMMADLISGAPHYAVGTLLIKGFMGLEAALVLRAFKQGIWGRLISGVIAELIMVGGYFFYACVILGRGSAAAVSMPGNFIQGAIGLIAAMLLWPPAKMILLRIDGKEGE